MNDLLLIRIRELPNFLVSTNLQRLPCPKSSWSTFKYCSRWKIPAD